MKRVVSKTDRSPAEKRLDESRRGKPGGSGHVGAEPAARNLERAAFGGWDKQECSSLLFAARVWRLGERFLDELAAVDGGALGAAVVQEGQAHVVQAQQVEHRGVDVVDVIGLVNRAEADLVS